MPSHPNGNDNGIMNILVLNRIALWKPKLFDELTVRETGAGRQHLVDGEMKKTIAKTYRYAKNYEKSKRKFCLIVITYLNDAELVENKLDKIAKKIKASEIDVALANTTDSTFEYINYYLEDK